MAILKDIKKAIEDGKTPEQPATAEFLQTMRKQMQTVQQEQKPVGTEDIVTAMMGMIGQTVVLDEKSAELYKRLAQSLLTEE